MEIGNSQPSISESSWARKYRNQDVSGITLKIGGFREWLPPPTLSSKSFQEMKNLENFCGFDDKAAWYFVFKLHF